jgi:hypothetical protein
MSTSTNSKKRFQRSFVPTTALAKRVDFDELTMQVTFTDGRVLSVPLSWFPLLLDATAEQRSKCEIGGGGVSLHWPDIDEDLSIAGLMAGVDRNSS